MQKEITNNIDIVKQYTADISAILADYRSQMTELLNLATNESLSLFEKNYIFGLIEYNKMECRRLKSCLRMAKEDSESTRAMYPFIQSIFQMKEERAIDFIGLIYKEDDSALRHAISCYLNNMKRIAKYRNRLISYYNFYCGQCSKLQKRRKEIKDTQLVKRIVKALERIAEIQSDIKYKKEETKAALYSPMTAERYVKDHEQEINTKYKLVYFIDQFNALSNGGHTRRDSADAAISRYSQAKKIDSIVRQIDGDTYHPCKLLRSEKCAICNVTVLSGYKYDVSHIILCPNCHKEYSQPAKRKGYGLIFTPMKG